MRVNSLGPKSWAETNLGDVVTSFTTKLVFGIFKVKKPKKKKTDVDGDGGDFVQTINTDVAGEEEVEESSDEDF